MRSQLVGYPQYSDNAVGTARLKNEEVPRGDINTHTRKVSLLVKRQPKSSLLSRPLHTTLLDLVHAVNEVIDDEQLIVATVAHLVNTHRVRLTGTFKNTTLVIV
jgi:hypothetical protein